jgi:HK97 family phage major capsid protein
MPSIDRTSAAAIIPEEVSREIITGVRKSSIAMSLLRRLPNMTTGTQRQPVLSMLPAADFVNGDAGMKVTTSAAWDKKQLVVGEIAAIVPIPQAVLDDSNYDIWGEVRPLIEESFGRVFDKQVFVGGNPKAPAEWPAGIITAAVTAGNVVTAGTGVDIAADVSAAMALLEEAGYDVTGIAAQLRLRAMLRDLRNTNNDPIFTPMQGNMPNGIYGVPTHFAGKGVWDQATALAVLGDWSLAVYSVRQDITYQIFDTGVISDDSGAIVYNLLQQDMVAMRAVMRLAWQIANPIDIDRAYGEGFPFAVLKPSA